ncbi:hypothetical protein CC80DRAFT_317587 [Byssothecium circinans]|uniref:Zn(2)-C6 fungal-type domain-containing protein n=1 Tax=Byssothecium circinans TaxID=147558 RepID=A0A6A5TC62_9PLEO|nr:hypothetical protein CC80DRAFT_317587 [Byssothecium circinans]
MENTTQQHTPQRRRRRRPAVSCVLCRRRKIRCNREAPCSNCVKSKSACAYDSLPTSLSPLTNTSEADLVGRIRELEQQVQRVTAQPRLSQSGSPQSA